MTQPPYGPPPQRPQDTPRSFPTYVRPDSQQHAQQSGAQPPYGQSSTQAPWVPPGQPQQPGPSPYGQPQYGQAPYGQAQYGQSPYGSGYPPPGNWPAPYGYGYPAAGGGGTNGLATAALICGAGGFIVGITAPVAIGLGIAALVQLKRRPQEGKGLAVAGLVLGALVTLGYALIIGFAIAVGAAASDDYDSAPAPRTSYSSDTVYVDELAVGECFDEADEEGEAYRAPCSAPHDAEIIANVTLPTGPYPGDKKVQQSADSGCSTEFARYVGIAEDKSELEPEYWWPDRDLWNGGDRVVVCAAYGPGYDQLTGSVKGTKR